MNGKEATALVETGEGGDAESPAPATGSRGSFVYRLVLLILCYVTVVIAWGQRNSWPDELLLSILTVPVSTLVAWQLYQTHRFGLEVDPTRGQQEQLIAALILAVGLASGQLFLMSVGLVCLGIGWLRPVKPAVDWAEWLKIPLLFVTALPFWIDFDGSSARFAAVLSDPRYNPPYGFPLAIMTTEARVLGYCGLVAMTLVLHGRVFWLSLPLLPIFLAGIAWLSRATADWTAAPASFRVWLPWLIGAVCMSGLVRLTRRLDASGHHLSTGQTMRRWFNERRHPPWLAVMVVAIVQTLPFKAPRFGRDDLVGLGGLMLLAILLAFYRARTVKGPIHSRSVAMVASGLALTLLAEFATSDELRHMALGYVLVGLLSWHCFWPLRVLVVASATIVLLVAIPESRVLELLPFDTTFEVRVAAAGVLMAVLAWLVTLPLPQPGARGYDEAGWVPSRRFALILLGLMMLFQTASAFWPEHDLRVAFASSESAEPGEPGSGTVLKPSQLTGADSTRSESVHVLVAYPRRSPYLLESPERMLQRRGWRVLRTERFAHPKGEAVGIKIENGGRVGTTLWWYELGDTAFASHLYARRVLWSSWHLANRNLRMIRLESTGYHEPEELADYARRHHWFEDETGAGPP